MPEQDQCDGTAGSPYLCRKQCRGRRGMLCYVSNVCRIAILPAAWWAIFGFGSSPSGTEWLRNSCGLGTVAAAGLMALFLALISTVALLPCGIHRRILRRRASRETTRGQDAGAPDAATAEQSGLTPPGPDADGQGQPRPQ